MGRSTAPLVNSSEPHHPLLHYQPPLLTIIPWVISTPLLSPILSLSVIVSHQHNLNQLVNCPTHTKGNILDLVLTNCDCQEYSCTSPPKQYQLIPTDYFLVSFDFHVWTPKTTPHTVFDFSKADLAGLSSFLMETDFSFCLQSRDVEFIWSVQTLNSGCNA